MQIVYKKMKILCNFKSNNQNNKQNIDNNNHNNNNTNNKILHSPKDNNKNYLSKKKPQALFIIVRKLNLILHTLYIKQLRDERRTQTNC